MRTDLFDFDLPDELIALHPVSPRDAARLLFVRPGAPLAGARVSDLPDLLCPGDTVVMNDTRVIMAELEGVRERDNARARVSVNLHQRIDACRWRAFARPAKRLRPGDRIAFGGEGDLCLTGHLDATVEAREEAEVVLCFDVAGTVLDEAIAASGRVPLPPYIGLKRDVEERDRSDYQTVFARREGAVAAPTAGLHFTPEGLTRLAERGITQHLVTLHVGAGTFLPVKATDTAEHRMHAEWGEITPATAAALNAVRSSGGRIVAIGTTSLRLLESAAAGDGRIRPFAGETSIFITPGYRFRTADLLLTNFHLPRSTLFMLVAAFSGLEVMQAAYQHAIREGYRFYSYGDACLLERA